MEMNLIENNANKLLSILCSTGCKAYFVGGFIRDSIMHRKYDDIDICTSLLPNEVVELLNKHKIKTFLTGIKHGTVTAVLGGYNYEITTFRTDGHYSDNRHPEKVEFVSNIYSDLERRDFTINAMAYNPTEGLIDSFSGYSDIKSKLIRTVGEPNKRFEEDGLRILRAIRFSSELNFTIEEKTKQAIFNRSNLLKNISVERIFFELERILLGDNVVNVLLNYSQIFTEIIPELLPTINCNQNTKWHIYTGWEHIVYSVSYAPKNLKLRIVMFLHDIGKPLVKTTDENGTDHFKGHAEISANIAEKILKHFNVSKDILSTTYTLIKYHHLLEKTEQINVKHLVIQFGPQTAKDLFEVRIADLKAHNPETVEQELNDINRRYSELLTFISRNNIYSVNDLNIKGSDLEQIGFKGKQIGDFLKTLLYAVVDNKVKNNFEELYNYSIHYIIRGEQ